MPLAVAIVDGQGKPISGLVMDTSNYFRTKELPQDDKEYCYLSVIDLYGDTVFNRLQIRPFLAEWKRWGVAARTDEEKALVRRIEELAEECERNAAYLKFFGD